MKLSVNGKVHSVQADPATPLLWVLRDHLSLRGTKFSCGIGECGACSVLMDGEPTRSCQVTLADAVDRDIHTIEGLTGRVADKLKQAWVADQVPQCGYCQPAQIIHASALLADGPEVSDSDIDVAMSSVLCRCGTYPEIKRAIHRAASEMRDERQDDQG